MKMVGTGNGGWDVPVDTWMWQLEQAKRGLGILVYDDGWHKFALARWLFGPIRDVMAWIGETPLGGGFTMDAPATIMWNHTSGLRDVFDITLAIDTYMQSDYYSSDERFEVTGSKGFARVNHCTAYGLQAPALEVYRDGEVRGYHALDDHWGSSFRKQTAHYLRWLRTGEGELLLDDTLAREVLAFLFAAYESSRNNRPVTLA
jgi:predicted dehydrogenase